MSFLVLFACSIVVALLLARVFKPIPVLVAFVVPGFVASDLAGSLRRRFQVPPLGESFVTRYIPGMENQFVIMSDESGYSRKPAAGQKLQSDLQEWAEARAVYPARSANAEARD